MIEGDKDVGRENYFRNNVHGDYYKPVSLCSPLSVLDKHGESLRLYFSFTEQLTWLSLALCLLSATNIYINFNGGYYNGTNKNDKSDPARGS